MRTTVGKFLKESRESVGVSQREVVNHVNYLYRNTRLSTGHLSEVEQGKTGVSIKKLNAITGALIDMGAK